MKLPLPIPSFPIPSPCAKQIALLRRSPPSVVRRSSLCCAPLPAGRPWPREPLEPRPQPALEQLKGKWDGSFVCIFNFKAEVEKTNPGSLVDIEYEKVGKKMRFTRMFVALKSCVDGFLNGCKPFLGVDSTHLTGKWKGQLASATGIDGHNWMFPVCHGVFGSETSDNWEWFF